MASTSETGHAKNVTNFEELISLCNGYGAVYNPANPNLSPAALAVLLTNANASLSTLNSTIPQWVNAVNAREEAFKPLSALTTRVVSSLAASGASEEVTADAKSIARKLKGERAGKGSTEPIDPNNPNVNPKTISVSQMSYDSRIENFERLIRLLEQQPAYTPNESDLNVAGLNTLLAQLRTLNTNTINTYTNVSNARLSRNNVLYNSVTGLVQVAANIKLYVKSVFGASSAQYKQIAGLKFRTDSSL